MRVQEKNIKISQEILQVAGEVGLGEVSLNSLMIKCQFGEENQ